jgi:glutaredoxin-related protein
MVSYGALLPLMKETFSTFFFQHLIERESGKVVLYLTTLGVIRETFNRCVKVRQILRTLLIKVEERDVFMSKENQHELGQRMGSRMPTLPQVFVDGQYLGVSPKTSFSCYVIGSLNIPKCSVNNSLVWLLCNGQLKYTKKYLGLGGFIKF